MLCPELVTFIHNLENHFEIFLIKFRNYFKIWNNIVTRKGQIFKTRKCF